MNFRINFFHLILVGGGIAVLAWFNEGFFNESAVCTHCGAMRHTRRTLWVPASEIQQTPMSIYLQSLEGKNPQPHQWLFTAGSGGPIRCALGRGRELYRAIGDVETVETLKSIRSHLGDAEARTWTARLLDYNTSTDASDALYVFADSDGDFAVDYAWATEKFTDSRASHGP